VIEAALRKVAWYAALFAIALGTVILLRWLAGDDLIERSTFTVAIGATLGLVLADYLRKRRDRRPRQQI